ncbi:MAG: hypothetical protein ACOC24_04850 [Desulfovibrionales bacterium]
MIFHFLLALVVAGTLSLVLVLWIGKDRAWAGFLGFLVIILLMSWAGGLWIRPVGPAVGGLYWVPFVLTGLLVALMIGAFHYAKSVRSSPMSRERKEHKVETAEKVVEVGAFFWVLLIILAIVIIVGYL